MAKVFTKLNISSNADASSGHRHFKKLSANSGGGGASLITFELEYNSYEAEEGMTWEEWIVSEYGKSTGLSTSGGYVFSGDNPVTDSVGLTQNANQQIIEGASYRINWGGSV